MEYIEKILEAFPEEVRRTASTATANYMFQAWKENETKNCHRSSGFSPCGGITAVFE